MLNVRSDVTVNDGVGVGDWVFVRSTVLENVTESVSRVTVRKAVKDNDNDGVCEGESVSLREVLLVDVGVIEAEGCCVGEYVDEDVSENVCEGVLEIVVEAEALLVTSADKLEELLTSLDRVIEYEISYVKVWVGLGVSVKVCVLDWVLRREAPVLDSDISEVTVREFVSVRRGVGVSPDADSVTVIDPFVIVVVREGRDFDGEPVICWVKVSEGV
jgi:hypothetical protein